MRGFHQMLDGVVCNSRRSCFALLGLGSLAACAMATPGNPSLSIRTSPEYATISPLGGGWRSDSPATVYLVKPVRDAESGCFIVGGFSATWLSGAVGSTPPRVSLCGGHVSYELVIQRPSDAPGLDYDLAFAMQQAAQQRAYAAETQRAIDDNWADTAYTLGGALGRSLAR